MGNNFLYHNNSILVFLFFTPQFFCLIWYNRQTYKVVCRVALLLSQGFQRPRVTKHTLVMDGVIDKVILQIFSIVKKRFIYLDSKNHKTFSKEFVLVIWSIHVK